MFEFKVTSFQSISFIFEGIAVAGVSPLVGCKG